ncbi:MAG: SpoIIE family protein phosphatase, partial [Phycisphaerae bacterium]
SQVAFMMTCSVDSGAMVRAMFGQKVSGDAAFTVSTDSGVLAVIIDVLGHGPDAHELAVRMQDYLSRSVSGNVVAVLTDLHERFRGSRGAAVGLGYVDCSTGMLHYAGIGNTVIRRFGSHETRLVSRDGVVGGETRTPVEETLPLADGDVVVMYTDGVRSHFAAADYPALRHDSPDDVAGKIVDRFGKAHDDASCVVMRYSS